MDGAGQVWKRTLLQRDERASVGRRLELTRSDDGDDARGMGLSDGDRWLARCHLQGGQRRLLPHGIVRPGNGPGDRLVRYRVLGRELRASAQHLVAPGRDLRRGDTAPVRERCSGGERSAHGDDGRLHRPSFDRRRHQQRPVLRRQNRRGSRLSRRPHRQPDPDRHGNGDQLAGHATTKRSQQPERDRRQLEPDRPLLDGCHRQRRGDRLPGRALPGCRVLELLRDRLDDRDLLQQQRPLREHELLLSSKGGGHRDQPRPLLEPGLRDDAGGWLRVRQ